jgi:serine/threonine protein kinase
MLQQGALLQDRYKIEHLIQQGGDHRLYRANDEHLEKTVIIKETFFRTESFIKQFEFEARLLTNLWHSALPVVTDYFIEPLAQYLVMEYIAGESLSSYLARQPEQRIDEATALRIVAPLLDALEYLHSCDPPIIHRDIQPANIYMSEHNKVYLMNFSIAKAYSPDKQTAIGAESVTPGYSPIEQYGFGRTDARSDLYALGATLYTMLSGTKPPVAVHRLGRVLLKPIRTLNPSVSTDLAAVITRLLAIQSQDRYPDVASLRHDLLQD